MYQAEDHWIPHEDRDSWEIWGETWRERWQGQVRQLGDHVKVAGESGERQLRGCGMQRDCWISFNILV
jgi:hypothetical protein